MKTPATGKILAIDYGRARIGLAVSDALRISIKPLGHINRESDEQAAQVVAELARQEQAATLLIGLPLHAHGDAGENVEWVRRFEEALRGVCDLPLLEVDERHSSQEAEELLRQEGQWPVAAGVLDAKAACVILHRYIHGET